MIGNIIKTAGIIIGVLAVLTLFFLGLTWLFNYFAVLFHYPVLDVFQTAGLFLLVKLFTGSFFSLTPNDFKKEEEEYDSYTE